MSPERVNLLSDTQTRPTAAMRRAIAGADCGDEQKGLDPTTWRLEQRVAELLGQEAALFLPSGSMCNLIAFRLHVRAGGDEVILAANSHPVGFEAGSLAAVNGAMTRTLPTATGIFSGADVRAALRAPGDRYAPRSRLVSVEQTTNMGGGRVWSVAAIDDVLSAARSAGLRAHLDGARLLNACVAAGEPPARYAGAFDTAWVDFTKGLGAPLGAVLAGSADLIAEAWRFKQMLGGAMRQSGLMAAGCLHALDRHVERLADDHENARLLAEGLAAAHGVAADPDAVETNIVMFEVADAAALARRAADEGVLVGPLDERRLRAVTHLDVDRAATLRAVEILAAAAAGHC